jgi:outer membrane lipoprotein carrier protein
MAVVKFSFRSAIDRTRTAVGQFTAGTLVLAAAAGPADVHGAADVATQSGDAAAAGEAIARGLPYGSEVDRDSLATRLAALAVYSATFTQTVYGARGEELEVSEGHVRLQRPQFKWVVEDPYPQTIVTEGDRLKLYDPDLEQLTIRPLSEALEDTPVSLLTRDDVAIGDAFGIVRIADADGETYLVDPRSPDTLYRQIQLRFRSGNGGTATLVGLDILDHLGQRTEIRFRPEANVASIPADEFALDVPPGTDVIGG